MITDLENKRIRRAIKTQTRWEIVLLVLAAIAIGAVLLLAGCDHIDATHDRNGTNQTFHL